MLRRDKKRFRVTFACLGRAENTVTASASYSARAHRALSKSPWVCGSISSRSRDTRRQAQRVQHRCAPVVLMEYALPRTDTALARAPCARGVSLWLLSTHPGGVFVTMPVCLVSGVCPSACTRFFRFPGVLDNASMSCATGRVSALIQDFDMVVCYDYVGCIHMLKSSRLNEIWWRYGCWRVAGILLYPFGYLGD